MPLTLNETASLFNFTYGGKMSKETNAVMKDKTDIKIFVLFLLDNINYPLEYTSINNLIIAKKR